MTNKVLKSNIKHRMKEVLFILLAGVSFFLLLSFATFSLQDPSWSHATSGQAHNLAGKAGAYIADIFFIGFGYVAYLFPFLLLLVAWFALSQREEEEALSSTLSNMTKTTGFILILLSSSALLNIYVHPSVATLPATSGGVIGSLLSHALLNGLNLVGSTLLLAVCLFSGITLFLGISWFALTHLTAKGTLKGSLFSAKALKMGFQKFPRKTFSFSFRRKSPRAAMVASSSVMPQKCDLPKPHVPDAEPEVEAKTTIFPLISSKRAAKKVTKSKEIKVKSKATSTASISLPGGKPTIDLNLLDEPKLNVKQSYSDQDLEYMSREVEQRLQDFGIEVQVVGVHPGPVITRFELALAPGIKASRISNLSSDLARSLSVTSVRVVEVIPGKSVVGLELPNKHRAVVTLKEVLASQAYQEARSSLSLALGKDIAGHPVVVDLAKMPHLLVAGTTGSGKSVGLNAMLLSLIYKSTPEEVRLVLVDPKMLELSIYEGIPHLLTPVVTDMKEAANVLRWCVAEMDKRYRLMSSLGVRNLASYNQKVKEAIQKKEPIEAPSWCQTEDQKTLAPLPKVVVVIDEFADMMMIVGKKVEQLIARIAQKARAAGIHLILATQRPSVNVITGLIKANIPTRIAFQVSSKIDSRTILDQQGAQQLLGHGDMLYLAPGTGVPVRVHGAFVDDDEVHRVVAQWKKIAEPEYLDLTVSGDGDDAGGEAGEASGEKDALYDQAVEFVIHSKKASISGVQRRFKIGYNRAARLVEDMEAAGLVGPLEGGAREVLVRPEQI